MYELILFECLWILFLLYPHTVILSYCHTHNQNWAGILDLWDLRWLWIVELDNQTWTPIISLIMGRNNNRPIVWELSCIIGGNQLPPFIASLTPAAEAGRAITHQTPDSRLWSCCDLFSSGFTLRDPTTSYAEFSHGELTDYPHHMHSLSPPHPGPGTQARAADMPLLFHFSFFTCYEE